MANLKVDLLSKKELIYELKLRGCPKDDTVQIFRKTLREILKLGIKENVRNLENFSLKEEVTEIEIRLNELNELADELVLSKNVNKVVRLESKLEHYERRLNILKALNVKKREITDLEGLFGTLSKIQGKLVEAGCTEEEKSKALEFIEESFQDEEAFNRQLDLSSSSIKDKVSRDKPVDLISTGINSMFMKLSNPIEQYLRLFRNSDGLVVELLLNFVKVLLMLVDETPLKAEEILNLSLGYCRGPLRAKILESINEGHDIERVHSNLLAHFVPITLRESLKKDLVLRPQKVNENLNDYVLDIKMHARLLKCQYSENEIVQLIVIGLNEETRSYLVFAQMPKTFAELDQLTVHCANVSYASQCRRKVNSLGTGRPMARQIAARAGNQGERSARQEIKCYNCGKIGHFARNCYRRVDAENLSKPAVPKNLRGESQ